MRDLDFSEGDLTKKNNGFLHQDIMDETSLTNAKINRILNDGFKTTSEYLTSILSNNSKLNNDEIKKLISQEGKLDIFPFFKLKLDSDLQNQTINLLSEKEKESSLVISKFEDSNEWKTQNNKKIRKLELLLREYEDGKASEKEEIMNKFPIESLQDIFKSDKYNSDINLFLKKLNIEKDKKDFLDSGAENYNYKDIDGTVEKTTQDRHAVDYFSMLQLILNMRKVERDFNKDITTNYIVTGEEPTVIDMEQIQVEVRTVNNGQLFYINNEGEYSRTIIQEHSKGISIAEKLRELIFADQMQCLKEGGSIGSEGDYKTSIDLKNKNGFINPEDFSKFINRKGEGYEYAVAYRKFLEHVNHISNKHNYSLDITNSNKALGTGRGNVLETTNVFVKEEDRKIIFDVLDPDVFNDGDDRDKFSVKENKNKKGFFAGFKTYAVNEARKLVLAGQKHFINESL